MRLALAGLGVISFEQALAYMAIAVVGLLVLFGSSTRAQPTNCATAISNATVLIPDTVAVEGADATFFDPDSIAAFSSDSTCVGDAPWRGGARTIMAVAGSGPFEETGLGAEDAFHSRLHGARGTQHRDGTATFVPCGQFREDFGAFCRDDGRYENDAVYVVRSIRLGPPSPNEEPRVQTLELSAPFPNPARGRVRIRFATPDRQKVELRLYDALGRAVRTFGNGMVEGRQELRVDLSGLASGAYFLRLRSEGDIRTRRITVVR